MTWEPMDRGVETAVESPLKKKDKNKSTVNYKQTYRPVREEPR